MDLRVSPGQENMCIEHPVVHPNVQTRDATFAYAQCCNKVGDASAPMGYAKLRLDGVAETEAYLLGLVYDSVRDQSSLMVFDLERELKQGPVCKIWLKTALPHGLHGCFAPDSSVQTSCFC
jgi:hypothetical protein